MLSFGCLLLLAAFVIAMQYLRCTTADLMERNQECHQLKLQVGRLLQNESARLAPPTPMAEFNHLMRQVTGNFAHFNVAPHQDRPWTQ